MNPRSQAIQEISNRKPKELTRNPRDAIEAFGSLTFNREAMQKVLSKNAYEHMVQVMEGRARLHPEHADEVAKAMKEWALQHGATHFCHWFQPLTGLAAEKHDAFIDWKGNQIIEKFTGKLLLRGEPDASSFPSGGLRNTAQARGYTTWDPTSPAFLWNTVLCIPSFFFSWTGAALDTKIPLMRSEDKIGAAVMRLLKKLKIKANYAFATLGCEQEYFLVDRALYLLRPDLLLLGRTLCGAPSAKGQELEDHYFRTIKERILSYIQDFESKAYALGIPLKTRHGEVAPAQYEAAPIFEKTSIAIDHNVLLMELMREVAPNHDLACLLHEKPYAGINGSGKHCNWSVGTDTGLNLFDPTDTPTDCLPFLIMLTATLNAVYKHGDLLRASISSAGNDHRLGGNEAPPPIISVFLGEALERVIDAIEKGTSLKSLGKDTLDLKIAALSALPKDNSDRNRTSPFAFTGNKFEFRAVGSSAHCALPLTVLNSIVATELNALLDEMEKQDIFSVIKKHLKTSKKICFSGNGYSAEWVKEAKRRGLPIIEKSFHAFKVFMAKKCREIFADVFTEEELHAHYHIMVEHYCKVMNMEAKLLIEMFYTQILPVALQYQKEAGTHLKGYSETLKAALKEVSFLEKALQKAQSLQSGAAFSDDVGPLMVSAREHIDKLELLTDDRLWPLPKYRELLFLL